MVETVRRLQREGATVGGHSVAADALYTRVISEEYDLSQPWIREW